MYIFNIKIVPRLILLVSFTQRLWVYGPLRILNVWYLDNGSLQFKVQSDLSTRFVTRRTYLLLLRFQCNLCYFIF